MPIERTTPRTRRPLRVVAAVIRRADGAVLLSRRLAHAEHAGLWEFPGGKLEARERALPGLARELREELGIVVERATPLIRVRHAYPTRTVELDVYSVDQWRGSARGCEGQVIEWVATTELARREFPAANHPVLAAARLPRLVLVTADSAAPTPQFMARLRACLRGGVDLVYLRTSRARDAGYRVLARAARACCAETGARLILNCDAELALALDADGLHLDARSLSAARARPAIGRRWLSAACHSAAELRHAAAIGADFAFLAPIAPTASHPGATALGWRAAARMRAAAALPVYALGGLDAAALAPAVAHGFQGVALLSGLWQAPDPAQVVNDARLALAERFKSRSRPARN